MFGRGMSEKRRQVEIRPGDIGRDADFVRRIDTSFETGSIIEVRRSLHGFDLFERALDTTVTKTFPLGLDDLAETAHEWEHTWLALDHGQPVGVVSTEHQRWNRRAVVWHLYVDAGHRRQGIARRLLDAAVDSARDGGALMAWLETSSLNVPGIRAYESLGFELCGFDTSLYEGTEAEGEFAIFLRRPLRAPRS